MSQESVSSKRSGGVASSITDPPARRRRTADPLAGVYPKATEWCFTFNNYSPEDVDDLVRVFNSVAVAYVFQREVAESGTPHLQGVVRFNRSLAPMEVLPKVSENYKKIHWERCRSWEHSIRYCSKEDTRAPDTEPIQKNIRVLPVPDIYGWQSELVDVLLPSFTPRAVHWFYERDGGVGKSSLVRYLCMTRSALLVSGKDSDIKHGVAAWLDAQDVGPELVLVDIPRCSLGYLSYSGIEQVANGCFFSSKYESRMVITTQPIIICFANEPPNFERMSKDRWKVFQINIDLQSCVLM